MPDRSKVWWQTKYSSLSSRFGFGYGTNDSTLGKITVIKSRWMLISTKGCRSRKEEEESKKYVEIEWEYSMDRLDNKFIQNFNWLIVSVEIPWET
jgi:hypothetical protein